VYVGSEVRQRDPLDQAVNPGGLARVLKFNFTTFVAAGPADDKAKARRRR
jgi:hypothetical protein